MVKNKMKEKFISNYEKLLFNSKWEDFSGECTSCGQETLEMSRSGYSLRPHGVIHCKSCNIVESLTNHVGKSMFPLQRMPEGALPFYLKQFEKKEENE